MSLCIGIILSDSVNPRHLLLNEKFGVNLCSNPMVTVEHMLPNERLYCLPQPDGTMDNSLTGIGSYTIYSQDVSEFRDYLNQYPEYYQRQMLDELSQQRQNYLKDADNWVERIRYIVTKIHVFKLFLYMFDDGSHIHIKECRKCTLSQLNREYLMKIPMYTVVTFLDDD